MQRRGAEMSTDAPEDVLDHFGFVDSCLAGKDTSTLRDALSTTLGEPAVVQLAMLIGYYSMIGTARAALGVKTGST